MKTIILCQDCGQIAHWSSYFQAYICSSPNCRWMKKDTASAEKPKEKNDRKAKIELINKLANRCGHFYNAYTKKDICVNNGYNCSHPDQEEFETVEGQKIGKCFAWSCPLGYEPSREDFSDPAIDNQGYKYMQREYVVVNF